MIKNFIVCTCLFLTTAIFAQSSTSSPYSFYGIGDTQFKGTVENRSMGGLSIFNDSIHINIQNPAAHAGLKLTTFTIGANSNNTILSSNLSEDVSKRTSIDYLAVGIPITTKFGVAFGLLPATSVGYKINAANPNAGIAGRIYDGSGGVNKFFIGVGYAINPSWSFGLNLDSNFGKITTNSIAYFTNIQYGTREINSSNINGIAFTTGLMYQSKLKSKIQYFGAINFTPESNLTLINERTIVREAFLTTDPISLAPDFVTTNSQNETKLPSKFSFGFGLGAIRKWQIGTEIILKNGTKFGNRFNDITNLTFENGAEFRLGGFFIPKFNSFNNYFARVTYRAGFNYQNTGMVINGKTIKDQNFSIGAGFPLGGAFSNLNISYEVGKRGTKMAGLIVENYNNLSIGLSLNDRWFVKRKYD